jgi:hypothetical protein
VLGGAVGGGAAEGWTELLGDEVFVGTGAYC